MEVQRGADHKMILGNDGGFIVLGSVFKLCCPKDAAIASGQMFKANQFSPSQPDRKFQKSSACHATSLSNTLIEF